MTLWQPLATPIGELTLVGHGETPAAQPSARLFRKANSRSPPKNSPPTSPAPSNTSPSP
jgi:hypothetical protein